jgi:hypothetical protein
MSGYWQFAIGSSRLDLGFEAMTKRKRLMNKSKDTMYRQWLMLSKMPRFPRRISVSELHR